MAIACLIGFTVSYLIARQGLMNWKEAKLKTPSVEGVILTVA
jgi:hypothetical protein